MSLALRTRLGAFLSIFVAACGSTQQQTNDPGQPSGTQDAPVIVLGRPTPPMNKEPQQVAEDDEPQVAVAATNKLSKLTDAEISLLVRDPRKERLSPRATQLVITEIQGMEALFASTPAASADRPHLIRRLVSVYLELKFAARRDKQHAIETGARQKPNEFERLDKVAKAAQTKALQYLDMLAQQYPRFCRSVNPADPNKSTGCVDDAYYFLGLEYLELGTLDQARKSFLKLLQSFPLSPWVPHTYLSFGELFFAEGQSDPSKLDFAQRSFEEVLKYPPPQNETYGFANYRLAQVQHLKQDDQRALSHFMKAIEFNTNFPALRSSDAVGDAARREIPLTYAAVGEPRKAEAFFKRIANDPPGSNERLVRMLDGLVAEYLRNNKRVEAADVCFSFSGSGNTIPSCRSIAAFQPSP